MIYGFSQIRASVNQQNKVKMNVGTWRDQICLGCSMLYIAALKFRSNVELFKGKCTDKLQTWGKLFSFSVEFKLEKKF